MTDKMTNRMLGGMIGPRTAEEATTPAEKPLRIPFSYHGADGDCGKTRRIGGSRTGYPRHNDFGHDDNMAEASP